jgi:general secretion pathway protein H
MISRGSRSAGFTLIELLVVVTILGLALALIAEHGPLRSSALERAAVISDLTRGLREARARAIAANRPVSVDFDVAHHTWQIGDLPRHTLPPSLKITILTTVGEAHGYENAGIRFEPDGSSTGGRIDLDDGRRKIAITVDWLSGAVSATREN